MSAEQIRFRGTVQGVGFRPTVARVARDLGLRGWVRNDGDGVLVALCGPDASRSTFVESLMQSLPPLARVESVERAPAEALSDDHEGFDIVKSESTAASTAIAADAATCPACIEEIRDPFSRRYRYPFTNCTHCGPRFSIVRGIPYDRPNTAMAGFEMCEDCRREYEDEGDRRYHAQPIACGRCGPTAEFIKADRSPISFATYSMLDDVDAARTLLLRGAIVAVKSLGGYQLCCDATNETAVALLRARKQRPHKPLALMAWDTDMVRRFCTVDASEAEALESPANPIVCLDADGPEHVAPSVAPDQGQLGFMLPTSPLHQLLLRHVNRPIVCTSGNRSEEPQCTDDDEALERLGDIADWILRHDRPIANRIDDSVVRRIAGEIRVLRRARGYAPAPLTLHEGFATAPPLTALGAQLKATVCLLSRGQAVLSPHIGDLDDPRSLTDYWRILTRLTAVLEHEPALLAMDRHPGYRTSAIVANLGAVPTVEVAHHHAHVASCLAEHGYGPDAPKVLGIVCDGLGMGADDSLWGGEFLAADFREAERLVALPRVAMLGGDAASREPWRSTLAHIVAALGWGGITDHADVPELSRLSALRTPLLDQALARAPLASSAGRLFDAVAGALGLHSQGITYEAQAPSTLEALVDLDALDDGKAYLMALDRTASPARFQLAPLWKSLLDDLSGGVDLGVIAARFHEGLALSFAATAAQIRKDRPELDTVALTGGVFQNRVLTERLAHHLERGGWRVLLHRHVPANDGGIALGQATIAAARAIAQE